MRKTKKQKPEKLKAGVYQVNQLPEHIQEKICMDHSDINVDYDWWDYVPDYCAEKLDEYGIYMDPKSLEFDLHSGRYVKFKFGIEDMDKFLKKMGWQERWKTIQVVFKLRNWDNPSLYFDQSDGEASFMFEGLEDEQEEFTKDLFNWEDLADETEKTLDNFRDELLKDLESQYEYLCSDEAIMETLEANDITYYYDPETEEYYEDDMPEEETAEPVIMRTASELLKATA